MIAASPDADFNRDVAYTHWMLRRYRQLEAISPDMAEV
jgi:hypothetical protein